MRTVFVVCVSILVSLTCFAANTALAGEGWWKNEPVSLIQTNLRETDSNLDANALVKEIKNFPANTILFSVGGIAAHYPTNVKYHYKSDYLPAGRDLVGEVIKEAHKADIRVIGRFDFSRARKEVFDAHPEWFFKRKTGEPVFDDNKLYNTCINGGYYSEKAIEILTEALERYDVNGLFFNWFGNLNMDYRRQPIGLCHCDACEKKFKDKYGRAIPDEADDEYREFIFNSAVEVAKTFEDLIHKKRPGALFMTYIDQHTDALVSEAEFYKWRPLPQWIYVASEQVNSAMNTRPDKMAFDLVLPYQDLQYRFATTAGPGLRALLYQNLAQGAFPAFVVLGTMDQPDKTALKAVRPVFQFYDKYKKEYVGQKNDSRVILYGDSGPSGNRGSGDYRGFYRLLGELHIPFKVTNNVTDLNSSDIDMVIIPQGPMPEALASYVKAGGSVLITGTRHPGPAFGEIVKLWENTTSSYMRVMDYSIFPSLRDTNVIFWEGDYLELEPTAAPPLTLIPPGQFGPPDKVSALAEKTDKPGLIIKRIGAGRVAFIPWHIGDLYYRFSNDKHRALVGDLVDYILPAGKRQLKTNAHPSVEITVMRQEKPKRTVVHLVNMIGHSGTAFFDAVEMRDITIELKGKFKKASTMDGQRIPTEISGGFTRFTVPVLNEYRAICLYE
jgi:hypothetical protein